MFTGNLQDMYMKYQKPEKTMSHSWYTDLTYQYIDMGDQKTGCRDNFVLEENSDSSCVVEHQHSLEMKDNSNLVLKKVESQENQMGSPYVPDSTHISPLHNPAINNM